MYYLAYGSNLNVEQMRWRCPEAGIVTTGMLNGYQLYFKGSKTGSYLTIEKLEGAKVPVAVWKVGPADIKSLDRYEGYPNFYYKRNVMLTCDDGKRHRCFVYIMREDSKYGIPSYAYMNTCIAGYQYFGFDKRYLQDALDLSVEYARKGA